jgi:hypothetical protein
MRLAVNQDTEGSSPSAPALEGDKACRCHRGIPKKCTITMGIIDSDAGEVHLDLDSTTDYPRRPPGKERAFFFGVAQRTGPLRQDSVFYYC